jgi:two-component system chemotaxis response regulator CheY
MVDESAPVLLVEPQAALSVIMSGLLHRFGFENIETAGDSTTALELLGSKGARLVIADMHIGPTNGLQLLRIMRQDDKSKRIPFLLAAESLSASEALAIKNAGVDSFLLKPFRADVLSLKIEAALKAQPKPRSAPLPLLKRSSAARLGRTFHRY